jgi:hypothetical protein
MFQTSGDMSGCATGRVGVDQRVLGAGAVSEWHVRRTAAGGSGSFLLRGHHLRRGVKREEDK